jgi:hypothetical protein
MVHDMTRETLGNHPKFVIPRVDRAVAAAATSMSKQAARPQID